MKLSDYTTKKYTFSPNINKWVDFLKGNGYINVSDLRDILRALDDNVSEDELDEMIAEIDTDGSGTVDFDGMILVEIFCDIFYIAEFMEMMSGEA